MKMRKQQVQQLWVPELEKHLLLADLPARHVEVLKPRKRGGGGGGGKRGGGGDDQVNAERGSALRAVTA